MTQSNGNSGLLSKFQELFGSPSLGYRAPGRVNLIGEHTDYNAGFVLPAAIGFWCWVAASPREDGKLIVHSENFNETIEGFLGGNHLHRLRKWSDYPLGVASILQEAGYRLRGANLYVRSEIPLGAGLSSSAALEVGVACALLDLSGYELERTKVAMLCQRAENEFVGARVGIMDQFISCLGKKDHALRLDCRSLEFEQVPIPSNVRLVICNTMVKHEHAGGEYNRRREECDEGVRLLSKWYPKIRALRDVSRENLEAHAADLPPTIYKRCSHIVNENQRVLDGTRALASGDLKRFGELMRESHNSLRDLYAVSCEELDLMVEAAEGLPGFYGGRMTGGGFGGCTVNLVNAGQTETFADSVSERYHQKTHISPDIYICSAANGASAELSTPTPQPS